MNGKGIGTGKTMKSAYLALTLLGLMISVGAIGQTPYQPDWESLKKYTVPDWFRDAKFGIFIHCGPYSVPAYGGSSYGEWYPYNMYRKGTTAHITIREDKPNPLIHETTVRAAESDVIVVATKPFSATAVQLRLTRGRG